jgi:DNA polymerase elongation subunit (family B)
MNLVSIEYVESNRKPYIVLFTRVGKQRVRTTIEKFQPYFYVPFSEKSGSPSFTAIDGESVVKVFTEVPEDVLEARKLYDKHYEADVRFTTRYLIDCIPQIDKSELRIQYTDIEVDPKTNQIISIAVYDNYLQKCITFVWRSDLS